MKNKQIIDDILNKYTNNGKIKYADIRDPENFKKRYKWYKEYLQKELPEFTFEEIVKFHNYYSKFRDVVYTFNGFDLALTILEKELENGDL